MATCSPCRKLDQSQNSYVILIILSKSSDLYTLMEVVHQHLENNTQNFSDLFPLVFPQIVSAVRALKTAHVIHTEITLHNINFSSVVKAVEVKLGDTLQHIVYR